MSSLVGCVGWEVPSVCHLIPVCALCVVWLVVLIFFIYLLFLAIYLIGYPASIVIPVSKSDYVKIISHSVLSGRFLVGLPFGSAQKVHIVVEC